MTLNKRQSLRCIQILFSFQNLVDSKSTGKNWEVFLVINTNILVVILGTTAINNLAVVVQSDVDILFCNQDERCATRFLGTSRFSSGRPCVNAYLDCLFEIYTRDRACILFKSSSISVAQLHQVVIYMNSLCCNSCRCRYFPDVILYRRNITFFTYQDKAVEPAFSLSGRTEEYRVLTAFGQLTILTITVTYSVRIPSLLAIDDTNYLELVGCVQSGNNHVLTLCFRISLKLISWVNFPVGHRSDQIVFCFYYRRNITTVNELADIACRNNVISRIQDEVKSILSFQCNSFRNNNLCQLNPISTFVRLCGIPVYTGTTEYNVSQLVVGLVVLLHLFPVPLGTIVPVVLHEVLVFRYRRHVTLRLTYVKCYNGTFAFGCLRIEIEVSGIISFYCQAAELIYRNPRSTFVRSYRVVVNTGTSEDGILQEIDIRIFRELGHFNPSPFAAVPVVLHVVLVFYYRRYITALQFGNCEMGNPKTGTTGVTINADVLSVLNTFRYDKDNVVRDTVRRQYLRILCWDNLVIRRNRCLIRTEVHTYETIFISGTEMCNFYSITCINCIIQCDTNIVSTIGKTFVDFPTPVTFLCRTDNNVALIFSFNRLCFTAFLNSVFFLCTTAVPYIHLVRIYRSCLLRERNSQSVRFKRPCENIQTFLISLEKHVFTVSRDTLSAGKITMECITITKPTTVDEHLEFIVSCRHSNTERSSLLVFWQFHRACSLVPVVELTKNSCRRINHNVTFFLPYSLSLVTRVQRNRYIVAGTLRECESVISGSRILLTIPTVIFYDLVLNLAAGKSNTLLRPNIITLSRFRHVVGSQCRIPSLAEQSRRTTNCRVNSILNRRNVTCCLIGNSNSCQTNLTIVGSVGVLALEHSLPSTYVNRRFGSQFGLSHVQSTTVRNRVRKGYGFQLVTLCCINTERAIFATFGVEAPIWIVLTVVTGTNQIGCDVVVQDHLGILCAVFPAIGLGIIITRRSVNSHTHFSCHQSTCKQNCRQKRKNLFHDTLILVNNVN